MATAGFHRIKHGTVGVNRCSNQHSRGWLAILILHQQDDSRNHQLTLVTGMDQQRGAFLLNACVEAQYLAILQGQRLNEGNHRERFTFPRRWVNVKPGPGDPLLREIGFQICLRECAGKGKSQGARKAVFKLESVNVGFEGAIIQVRLQHQQAGGVFQNLLIAMQAFFNTRNRVFCPLIKHLQQVLSLIFHLVPIEEISQRQADDQHHWRNKPKR